MNLETPYEWWVLFMEGIKPGAYECGVLTSQFLSIGIIIYTAIHDIGLILETSVWQEDLDRFAREYPDQFKLYYVLNQVNSFCTELLHDL